MLELRSVSRSFGDVQAVVDADVKVEAGQITAIIGENGAGKSTLMKVGAGVIPPSAGSVWVDGQPLLPATPEVALERGVGMVHQHFMLVGPFTALENMMLGFEPTKGARLDLADARARAEALMEKTGLRLQLDAITSRLSVGEQQRLEILRVLFRGARVLLLDEPTAVLSPLEAEELYGVLNDLAEEGRAVAVVTHRLDEVVRFASRVTVMRRGRVVLSASSGTDGAHDIDVLTQAIMGREPPPPVAPPVLAEDADVILGLEDLTVVTDGRTTLDGFSVSVRAGEIVGIAGVEGNGQRELCRALSGLQRLTAGTMRIGDRLFHNDDVQSRRAHLGVVHEDRHSEGLVFSATVHDNFLIGELSDFHASIRGGGGYEAESAVVKRRMDRFGIRPPDPSAFVDGLSGGNQQKIVTGRVFDRLAHTTAPHKALVLSQPTRGVDVGAASVIHDAIVQAAASGMAVLVISADLGELRRLSHRLVVMRRGKVVAELAPAATDDTIGRAMLGLEAA